MKVFLTGFMGSGKTTLGAQLARKMKADFIDTDQFIVKKHGKTIVEIFAQDGEDTFRQMEKGALQDIIQLPDAVIATGGGMPCFFDNMEVMKKAGKTVYLKLSPSAIANRLAAAREKRPLLSGKTDVEILQYITETLSYREKWYTQANFTVDALNLNAETLLNIILYKP